MVKLGDLEQKQEDYETARSNYAEAIELFQNNAADEQFSVLFQAERGNTHTRLGVAYAGQDKASEAETEFQTAIEQLSALANKTSDPTTRRFLAVALVNAGELLLSLPKVDSAIENLESAMAQFQLLDDQSDDRIQLAIARTHELLGRGYALQGKHQQALNSFDAAVALLLPLVAEDPDHPDYLDALASAYISKAESFRSRGSIREMLQVLQSSLDYYRALRDANPDVIRYTERLAIALTNTGLALHESGFNHDAQTRLSEANDLLTALVDDYPLIPRFLEQLATCRDAIAQVSLDLNEDPGNDAEAAELYFMHLTSNAATNQEIARFFELLAIAQSHLAQTHQRNQQIELARSKFQEAQVRLEGLIKEIDDIPRYRNALAHVHDRFAHAVRSRGCGSQRTL